MVMHSEQISDRNSSRVLAAPGGRSDMASLLGGYAEAPAPAVRAIAAAPAASSNPMDCAAGQRIQLRTEHTGITGHSSSRVLAAPGGRSDMASIMSGGGGVMICLSSNQASRHFLLPMILN